VRSRLGHAVSHGMAGVHEGNTSPGFPSPEMQTRSTDMPEVIELLTSIDTTLFIMNIGVFLLVGLTIGRDFFWK